MLVHAQSTALDSLCSGGGRSIATVSSVFAIFLLFLDGLHQFVELSNLLVWPVKHSACIQRRRGKRGEYRSSCRAPLGPFYHLAMCLLRPTGRTTAICSGSQPDTGFVSAGYYHHYYRYLFREQKRLIQLSAHNVERVLNVPVQPELRLDVFIAEQSLLSTASSQSGNTHTTRHDTI